MTKTTNWSDLPIILNAADVARVLGISKPVAYEVMHKSDFPSIRVSERRLIVGKDKLMQWLDEQAGV